MGYAKTNQSGHTGYGITEFIIDTDADKALLPVDCAIGSSALSIASGNYFILNTSRTWTQLGGAT